MHLIKKAWIRVKLAVAVLFGGISAGFRELAKAMSKSVAKDVYLAVMAGDVTETLLEYMMGLDRKEAVSIAGEVVAYLGYQMAKRGYTIDVGSEEKQPINKLGKNDLGLIYA